MYLSRMEQFPFNGLQQSQPVSSHTRSTPPSFRHRGKSASLRLLVYPVFSQVWNTVSELLPRWYPTLKTKLKGKWPYRLIIYMSTRGLPITKDAGFLVRNAFCLPSCFFSFLFLLFFLTSSSLPLRLRPHFRLAILLQV